MSGGYRLHDLAAAERYQIGPFQVETRLLPHFVPNLGVRLQAEDRVVAYTGDTGPSSEVSALARGADVLLAEATFAEQVPARFAGCLSSGRDAGRYAAQAGVGRLMLTHLWPGEPAPAVVAAARVGFSGPVAVATAGLVVDVGDHE